MFGSNHIHVFWFDCCLSPYQINNKIYYLTYCIFFFTLYMIIIINLLYIHCFFFFEIIIYSLFKIRILLISDQNDVIFG